MFQLILTKQTPICCEHLFYSKQVLGLEQETTQRKLGKHTKNIQQMSEIHSKTKMSQVQDS